MVDRRKRASSVSSYRHSYDDMLLHRRRISRNSYDDMFLHRRRISRHSYDDLLLHRPHISVSTNSTVSRIPLSYLLIPSWFFGVC